MSSAAVPPDLFRRACALFPTGVAVLTTLALDGTPHGLTINAFCSLSLRPPLVLVAIDRESETLKAFEHSGHFAINFLTADQRDLSIRFSQLPEGRFTGVSWSAGSKGAPILDQALGTLQCRTTQIIDTGDHRALIGEVTAASITQSAPLVYFRSQYRQIAH